jgi:aminopeptidase N
MHGILDGTMENMQIVSKLIEQFVPEHYNLSISLNRLDRTFGGIVTIQGTAESNSITLHSKELTIESIVVDGKEASFAFGTDDSLIISHPDIQPGHHIIVISYNGKITDSMHGLYPCYYDHDGIKKELLATQFESHHAREVLPCIDEPAAKATFDVTLTTETNVSVISNMPIKTQLTDGNHLVTTFDTTPRMSSYLLAWVVGEMHRKTAYTKSGIEVSVWATPAQPASSLDFALDISVRSIDFFEEYFDTPYPLPKSDQVALPDFSSGAMENWGLVTYREMALLVDPKTTSIFSQHYVASVIAHELSHQWFGNLVTMEWWNDLWLNESFATMMEYVAVDAIEPSWDIWQDFNDHESTAALQRDSLAGVQPVQTDVNHPDEIHTLFDGAIVYAKGARLLRMLHKYIGDEAFRSGLTSYFKAHAYKNTEAADLWLELSKTSKKDTASLMSSWISQPGFPVVHASINDNQITLTQERLVNISDAIPDTLWPIPLNSNYPELPEVLDSHTITVIKQSSAVLRLNIDNTAHFITHYSSELLEQLIGEIKAGKLTQIDRLQLLNEQAILARAGIISSAELIPLLDAFRNETSEPVWSMINLVIGELKRFVDNDKDADLKLRSYATALASAQYERLGWIAKPDEPETDTKLRMYIVGLMSYGESPEVIESAIKIYNSAPLEDLAPETRSLVLSIAIRDSSDEQAIKTLLQAYKTTNLPGLKQDICSGLTTTREQNIINLLLDTIKDTSIIRSQDTFRWILYLLMNKYARTQIWQWVRDNWDWIKLTYGGDKNYDDYPRFAAMALATPAQLNEYIEFFTPLRADPCLTRNIDMGIAEIKNRVERIERDGSSVREKLLNL